MRYAHVSVLKRPGDFDQPLTYEVPVALAESCLVGQGVLVPLRGKTVPGIVVGLTDSCDERIKDLKAIQEILPELRLSQVTVGLAKQISYYYRCSLLRALKLFVPKMLWEGRGKRILKSIEAARMQTQVAGKFPMNPLRHELTASQLEALDKIKSASKPVLLHGVTSSGKTEIYLRAFLEAAEQGKQSMLLVPEIALTPQMIDYFGQYFGQHMAVFHSRLSDGERLTEYARAQSGQATLLIGSRSAVFAPFNSLGVIVVDEEHEWTYKQESAPYYETYFVAEVLQSLTGAKLIFGTATPRVETLHKAKEGIYDYVRLDQRVNDEPLPVISIVDLREEMRRKNFSIFSVALQQKIRERLEKKEQVILFVNQRGMARAVMCRDCGQSVLCPSCEVSLKLHGGSYGSRQYLLCHYCSYETAPKLSCEHCGSVNIRHVGLGTERVEEELLKFFPQAKVLRADKDTTSEKSGFEPIYQAFKGGGYDVLVGTQMVAKGLDFPGVTLIGIILADIGLHIPDFRSHERIFHLITQVAGRAGRGQQPGEVILQTYQPEHHAIKKAAAYHYDEFIEQEMVFRKKLNFPPYSNLIKFTVVGNDAGKLRKEVELEHELLEDIFKTQALPVSILSAPSLIPKVGQQYYYNVLLRGKNPQAIFDYWKVPGGWRVDIDPVHSA